MTYGIKVSLPTKDISSNNPSDFVLHSDYSSTIIYKEAEVSVTVSASSTTKSTVNFYESDGITPKTFSYIPIVYIMSDMGTSYWYPAPFTFNSNDSIKVWIDSVYNNTSIENNKFYITFHNDNATSKTIKYHYYILANLGL